MPNVNIPGKGIVQFPDSMTPADIEQAIASMDSVQNLNAPTDVAPQEQKKEVGIINSFKEGLGESVPGMMLSQKAPDFQPANFKESIGHMAGTMAGDWPLYVGGFLLGGGASLPTTAGVAAPVMATAGSMALPMGIRKVLIDRYEKGEIETPHDFFTRALGALTETGKGEIIGAAGGLAAKPFQASKYWSVQKLKTPAEITAFTTVAAGLEGRMPTKEDFAANAVAMGGIYGAGRAVKAMKKVYVKTGKTPKEVAADIEQQKAADNSEVTLTDIDLNMMDKEVQGKADFVTDSQMSASVPKVSENMVTVKGAPEVNRKFDREKYNNLVAQGINKKDARKQATSKVPVIPPELKPDVPDRRAEVQANLEANKAKLDAILDRGIVTERQVEELLAQGQMRELGLDVRPADDAYRTIPADEALLAYIRNRDKPTDVKPASQAPVDRRAEVADNLAVRKVKEEAIPATPDLGKGTVLAETTKDNLNTPIESGLRKEEPRGSEFYYQTGDKRGELNPEALKAEQDHVSKVFPELSIRFDEKGELPIDAQAQLLGKVITLSKTKADVTSIPHEVVHHAIRMMPENPLVVKGMKMFGDLEQLTQRVADFYAGKITDRRVMARVSTWLKEFWSSVKNGVGKANKDDVARLMSRDIYNGKFSAGMKAEKLTPFELTSVRNTLLFQGGNPDRINTKLKVFDNLASMKQNINLDQLPLKNISKEEGAFLGHVVAELKANGKKTMSPQEFQDAVMERLMPIEIKKQMEQDPGVRENEHRQGIIANYMAQNLYNGGKIETSDGSQYFVTVGGDGIAHFMTKQQGDVTEITSFGRGTTTSQISNITTSILEDVPSLRKIVEEQAGPAKLKDTTEPLIVDTVGNQGNPKDFGVNTTHRYFFDTPIDFVEDVHGGLGSTTAAGWFEAGRVDAEPGTLRVFEVQPSDAVKDIQKLRQDFTAEDIKADPNSNTIPGSKTSLSDAAPNINRYFYRSIIQWAAKQGYTKVQFPVGKSVEEIEGVEPEIAYFYNDKLAKLSKRGGEVDVLLDGKIVHTIKMDSSKSQMDNLAENGIIEREIPAGTVQLYDNMAGRMEKEYNGRTTRIEGDRPFLEISLTPEDAGKPVPLFQKVPRDNTPQDILDEVAGTNLHIEDVSKVKDIPIILKSVHFAEHVLRDFPAALSNAGQIIEAGMRLNDRVGRGKEWFDIAKGDLTKEEQKQVRSAMEKMYAGEETGAGDRVDRAARMMTAYFEEIRSRFKESRRDILKQDVPDNVYRAFDQIIHGGDIRTAVSGMSEQDVATLRKSVGEYNDINKWGMDDFITHIELGAWKILKPDGEVVGVAETRREAYVKARELAKTDGYTTLKVEASAKMPQPVKATKNILKGEENIFDVMDAYSYSVEKRINLDPVLEGVKKDMQKGDIEQYPDGVRKYLDKMIADSQGTYSIFEKAVDGMFLKAGRASGQYNKIMHGIMQGEAWMKLGYRATAGFINGVVGFAHTYVKRGAFIMNEADRFNNTPEGKAFLARNEPYLGLGYIMDTGGKMRIKSPILHPLKMFTFAEPAIRKNNLTANYLQFLEDGMSPEAAEVAARRALRFQQNLFSIAGMPEILRSKEMRIIGMFKSFLIREMEFIASLRGDEVMRYMGMFFTLGGPKAMMATLLSMPLIASLTPLDDLDNKLNEEYPGWYRGLPGLIGADLSMSTALQLPQKATDWAGPFVADVIKLGQELGPLFGGKKFALDAFSTREGLENVMGQMVTQSRYMTKLLESMIDKEGWVRNSKGQKLYRINNDFERALLVAGANPTHVSQEQQVMHKLEEEAKAKSDNVSRVLTHATRELRRTKRLSQDTVNEMLLLGITPESLEERVKGTELEPFVRYLLKTPDRGKPGVIDAWPSNGQ